MYKSCLSKTGWLFQKKRMVISSLKMLMSSPHSLLKQKRHILFLAEVLPQTDGNAYSNSTRRVDSTVLAWPRKGTQSFREGNLEPSCCVSRGAEANLRWLPTQPTAEKPKWAVQLVDHSFAGLHKGIKFLSSSCPHLYTLSCIPVLLRWSFIEKRRKNASVLSWLQM